MNISTSWVVLDTNIWIFGIRNHPERWACAQLLDKVNQLYIRIPRQILLELGANLSRREMSELFRLWYTSLAKLQSAKRVVDLFSRSKEQEDE